MCTFHAMERSQMMLESVDSLRMAFREWISGPSRAGAWLLGYNLDAAWNSELDEPYVAG